MGRFDNDDSEKLSTKSQKEFEAFEKLTKLSKKELNTLGDGLDEAIDHFKGRIEKRKQIAREAGLEGGFDEATRKKGAKNGFMGMINTKTMFTVGEKNKREHVSRKKSNNIFDTGFKF